MNRLFITLVFSFVFLIPSFAATPEQTEKFLQEINADPQSGDYIVAIDAIIPEGAAYLSFNGQYDAKDKKAMGTVSGRVNICETEDCIDANGSVVVYADTKEIAMNINQIDLGTTDPFLTDIISANLPQQNVWTPVFSASEYSEAQEQIMSDTKPNIKKEEITRLQVKQRKKYTQYRFTITQEADISTEIDQNSLDFKGVMKVYTSGKQVMNLHASIKDIEMQMKIYYKYIPSTPNIVKPY